MNNTRYLAVLILLAAPALVLVSGNASAQLAVTDPPVEVSTALIEGDTSDLDATFTAYYADWQTWEATNTLYTNDIDQNTSQIVVALSAIKQTLDKNYMLGAQQSQGNGVAQQQINQQTLTTAGIQKSVDVFNQGVEQNYCNVAQQRENVGNALPLHSWGHSVATSAASNYPKVGAQPYTPNPPPPNTPANNEINYSQLPTSVLQPDYVGVTEGGTLQYVAPADQSNPLATESELSDQIKFVETTLAPVVPTDPSFLPDRFKALPSAALYQNTYKMWKQNYDLASKVAMHQIEMQSPTIVATPDILARWKDIVDNNPSGQTPPCTPQQINSNSCPQGQFQNQLAGLFPTLCMDGSTANCISELDYLRTQLFGRYSDPKWGGEELGAMNEAALMKELAEIGVMNGRMLYEIMISTSAMAEMDAMHYAHENNQNYGGTLSNIMSEMQRRN